MRFSHFSRLLTRIALVLGWGAALSVAAAPVKTEHVEAELVAAKTALVPGQSLDAALRLKVQPGWHTYWRNPGDSGLPTTLAWKLPAGVSAGALEWPAPQALPAGPLVNYGYEGEVLHPVKLTASNDLKPGDQVTLAARADWLVCTEICIPDGADLTLELPVASTAGEVARFGPAIEATRAALPKPLEGWRVEARGNGAKVALTLTPPAGTPDAGTLRFFPYDDSRIEPSAPQSMARSGDGYVLTLPVSSQLASPFKSLTGVISATKGFGDGALRAATLEFPVAGIVSAGPKPALDGTPAATVAESLPTNLTLLTALLFAFVGGVVLNLMPCVFPVLSLKALSLAAPGHLQLDAQRRQGMAFAIGVVLTFLALGAVLSVARAAGEQLGWGFQLQSPAVVTALAVLFFVLALNLSGVFEFAAVATSAAGFHARNPYADSFVSGILAVVIASPCTAPFMGAALGYAFAQSTLLTLVVFAALGLGMALPYLLLAWFPGWRRVLPKPGKWMEHLRQFLAFPLYATVAWLAWVLGAQLDNDAVARLLITLTVIAFALWAWRIYRVGGRRVWSGAAIAGAIVALVIAWPLFAGERPAASLAASEVESASGAGWGRYSAARVDEITREGRPVFVDFTAAWCVTCQVNKRLVLNDAGIRREFANRNVVMLRADWTRRDPAITQALTALGRNGVPVYVLYRPGKEPLLLPEVLQKGIVIDALATIASPPAPQGKDHA